MKSAIQRSSPRERLQWQSSSCTVHLDHWRSHPDLDPECARNCASAPPPAHIDVAVEGDQVGIALTSELPFDQPSTLVFRYHTGVESIEWTESVDLAPESSFVLASSLPADVLASLATTEHDAWLSTTLHVGTGMKLGAAPVQLAGEPSEATLEEVDGEQVLASQATVVQHFEGPVPHLVAGGTDDQ